MFRGGSRLEGFVGGERAGWFLCLGVRAFASEVVLSDIGLSVECVGVAKLILDLSGCLGEFGERGFVLLPFLPCA